ncbi:helix-turn-helix transcriptional regulator [Rhizobium lentis]|uniref:Helix-turn-helix transcriptional regulator n=1 Tax=Rhizobium lentis TaxID=1138194 RepID=A0A9Q3ME97_9HYPH|nr:XRE family transcriptional regulator [Rhizobium lentis]MBX4955847.1 helix-turn-helix transcriptional regulator [Rhizobium lentis]MBX4974497.1 helix-turn-helix transcriptional regulator [Rhizobium lentis]MBX4985125.1 helix-turn-helix transcriptional regulator [Rhizobium lentis]MBX4996892.1 helix-turn-helix transcriptional regulator [Rhizobium lentis]MBX5003570.1 helix-turn-helix transcriptional regulator [Rhizobium lentis]
MLSDTLSNELQRYAIGPRIKTLRLRKKLGLVQLAGHTGLSPAMLSKIERGQMFPTLPTLLRIAMVFGVGLDHFFKSDKEEPLIAVVRKHERLKLPNPPGEKNPAFLFESLDYPASDRRMEAYYAEFPIDSPPSEPHQHGSAEFIYVLSGRLVVIVDGKETALAAGDAMYFDSSVPHSYRREGEGTSTALVVISP